MDFRINAVQPYDEIDESFDRLVHNNPSQKFSRNKMKINEEFKAE